MAGAELALFFCCTSHGSRGTGKAAPRISAETVALRELGGLPSPRSSVRSAVPRGFTAAPLGDSFRMQVPGPARTSVNCDSMGEKTMKTTRLSSALAFLAALLFPGMAFAQSDPGVRPGAINGQPAATATNPLPLPSVAANSPTGVLEFFQNGLDRFQAVEVVSNGANNGLCPRFNFNQCSGCHSQPTIGGSSPANNPEAAVITAGIVSGSTNTIPSFITPNGPTREARFPFFFNANGTANTSAPNGGVEDLFNVSGRADAGNCSLSQPSFAVAQPANN